MQSVERLSSLLANEEWIGRYLDQVHEVVASWEGKKTPKKTWVTEFGWTTKSVSDAIQAANLMTTCRVLKAKPYVAVGT